MKRTIVTLPTYNEAENIGPLIKDLRALGLEVLVADDNSPDGTWKIVEECAARDPGVHLLRRMERKGRGYAGAEAFGRALELGAEYIVEMDADYSHQPRFATALVNSLEHGADLAIGSRLVPGGGDVGRSWYRRWLTGFSALYARAVLKLPIRDANSGFRAYTRQALERLAPATLISAGPSIVHEIYGRAARLNLRQIEIPIDFVERRYGKSQLTIGRLLNGFLMIWRVRRLLAEWPAKDARS